ncbi:3-phenylpropionate/cinnamic acid dioxygenase subunit beta [Acinetobacter baumannii]|uniref:3-phenylpropionate/cinnamic acid dioxygenase subunit beta n=1 Tax=Acinetobacter baumannii TaxID=470 RepID=UPI00233FEA4B|nr:3-phenylpropionate/cinnamic acid dioxygenase subunit beta [Acinetobacter baumannii]
MTVLTDIKPAIDLALKAEIEDFFYQEADYIDERKFKDWLDMLHEDIKYFMPMRRNVKFGQHAERENTREGMDISWFDEGKWTLTKRVEQILTGVHYAEEPLSRTSHLISNVRVLEHGTDEQGQEYVKTSCRFFVYLNRVEYEVNEMIGKRYDKLVKTAEGWKVLHREIILDQNVLLVKNLTTFF